MRWAPSRARTPPPRRPVLTWCERRRPLAGRRGCERACVAVRAGCHPRPRVGPMRRLRSGHAGMACTGCPASGCGRRRRRLKRCHSGRRVRDCSRHCHSKRSSARGRAARAPPPLLRSHTLGRSQGWGDAWLGRQARGVCGSKGGLRPSFQRVGSICRRIFSTTSRASCALDCRAIFGCQGLERMCLPKHEDHVRSPNGSRIRSFIWGDSGRKDILSQWGLPKSTCESGFCPESVAAIGMHSKACGGRASAPKMKSGTQLRPFLRQRNPVAPTATALSRWGRGTVRQRMG